MKFTAYSKENGMVLFSGEGHDPKALENETRAVLLGVQKDGGWISSDEQHHNVPDSPGSGYEWDWATKEWFDPRTLDDLRTAAHAAIERWRDDQEHAGMKFWHAGRRWDGGLVVRQRLQPVLGLAALPDGFFWTDADNSDVPISMPALQSLSAAHEQALVLRGFEIHARQRAMKAEIADMDRAELLAFAPGWPPA